MKNEERYRKVLAKTVGMSLSDTIVAIDNIFAYSKSANITKENLAKIINGNFKEGMKNNKDKMIIRAAHKNHNFFAINNKQKIIDFYDAGMGYKKIHTLLKEQCKSEAAKHDVISPSSIRKYLHEIWKIEKRTRDRRIPVEAIDNKQKY